MVYHIDTGELFAGLSYVNALVSEEGRRGVIEFLRGQCFCGPNLEPTARGFYEEDRSKMLTRIMHRRTSDGIDQVIEISGALFDSRPIGYLAGEEAKRRGVAYLMVWGDETTVCHRLDVLSKVQTPKELKNLGFEIDDISEYNQ